MHEIKYSDIKDRKGRNIYDGDFYEYTINCDAYHPAIGNVSVEKKSLQLVKFKNGHFYHGNELLLDVIKRADKFEYIGNIYEM